MTVGADQVVVTVADHGVGIAPEALPHIFDLFAVDTNVPFDESGLGIGLAVVHELVRAHGGTVAASSAGKDLGSEFIVRLPLAGGSAAPRS
jgi:signal transduction histidine kinase